MKTHTFNTLTLSKQTTRFEDYIRRQFGASVSAHLLSYTNNALYHIRHDGEDIALRIHRPGLKRREWIASELLWLEALSREAGVCVPRPLRFHTDTLDGVDVPVYAVSFAWIDGMPRGVEALTLDDFHMLGQFAARLHNTHVDTAHIHRPRLDWEGLFGADSPYYPGQDAFTPSQTQVLDAVAEQVREVMCKLDALPDTFGLIHADFIPKNLLWTAEGALTVIDFDDCGYGYYLYDLAPMLLFSRHDPRYSDIRAALWDGYTALRPMPAHTPDMLEAFIAGRYVASCRWIAGNRSNPAIRDRAPEIIAGRVVELAAYLAGGKL